ncbi:MAG: phospholipid/cholesterol/gamma-HCH transport system ATP-binding protein [Alphaproteobacteria bacterium]|jgi:phospholipid/cholesterol/gamma-HCH transport system ATP-binding protein
MSIEDQAPKIDVKNLHKSFGIKSVLSGVDLSVNHAQSLVILGGSGSGKSVLLKCMIGLMNADSGTIKLDGTQVNYTSKSEREKNMTQFGMLFQSGALFDSLTVADNITFGLVQKKKYAKSDILDIATTMLKKVGLKSDVALQFPSELSGGMQKRVSLARAICTQPNIIFFDEPTTGLDPIMAGTINDLIREVVTDLKATSITITHDMHSMNAIADKVCMLYEGRILWTGTPQDIHNCDNNYVKCFVSGTPLSQ